MIEDRVTPIEPAFVDSFESFYRRAWHRVYRAVAVGIGESDLAREAADEAMVRAYERWRTVSKMGNPEGWVYRVAMNWATTRLRRRRLLPRGLTRLTPADDPQPADPALVEAVRTLPAGQRDVVIARCLLDMSEADTSRALGIAIGTVKSRLSRALASLKEVLQ